MLFIILSASLYIEAVTTLYGALPSRSGTTKSLNSGPPGFYSSIYLAI